MRLTSQYWCWISSDFPVVRIAGDYAWLWLTLIVSILVYLLLFLWSMRLIVPDDEHCWKLKLQIRAKSAFKQDGLESEIQMKRPLAPSMALLASVHAHTSTHISVLFSSWSDRYLFKFV